jgi:hypothetical protein
MNTNAPQRGPLENDLDRVIDFIRANPGTRSGEIRLKLGLTMSYATSILLMLRRAGKLKLNGMKKAATYTVT